MIPDFAASPFFLAAAVAAFFRARLIRFTLHTLAGLLLLALGALAGTISKGKRQAVAVTLAPKHQE